MTQPITMSEKYTFKQEIALLRNRQAIFATTKPGETCQWCKLSLTTLHVDNYASVFVLSCPVCASRREIPIDKVKPMPKIRKYTRKEGLQHYEQGEISERIKSKIPEIIRLRVDEKMSDEQIADRVWASQTRVHIIRKKWEEGELVVEGYPPQKLNFQARSGKKPLTEKQIADILALKGTDKQYVIAAKMGVSRSVVSRIWLKKRVGMRQEAGI